MNEDRAAKVLHTRAIVVIELDHEIVEMIFALKAVALARRRELDCVIVAAVVRVLAPRVIVADRAYGQTRRRTRQAIGTPPKS